MLFTSPGDSLWPRYAGFWDFACILEHDVDIRTLSYLWRIFPTVQAMLQS